MTSSRPLDKIAAGLAFVLGLVTILAALGSQFIGGLQPCELCLEQRLPYYWGLPLLALVLILWNRLPLTVWYVAMAIVAALFAWGAYLGGFHSGVEWGFWPGPTACAGVGSEFSMDMLNDLQPVISCDVVQFRFLGLSLAGYNALISAAIVGLLGLSILFQARHKS
ncbi:disulfide bond formation protein DsbB [Devosia subaequoris]|uniref:Disulfide bond formation protein DsbB n=1 Tax=Devosia subaequoris TaxID=395930 RepID=A0A7W6IMV7_9HYPH|nr:disulfide bond formation protein B [Devosia subaequoris]MBB4052533.1 disulfide bond formation protein DsbB [Devosia subaequoris]MCP1209691.1 disulfide bond formation protein B [Devosia subaequoris]